MTETNTPIEGKLITAEQLSAAVPVFADGAKTMLAVPAAHLISAMIVTPDAVMYGPERSGVRDAVEVELPTGYSSADLLHFWCNDRFVSFTCELIALLRLRQAEGTDEDIEAHINAVRIILISLLHNGSDYAAQVCGRRR